MPPRTAKSSGAVFARVHAWVAKIPRGRVATYGQLSELVDGRVSPVGVGWALRAGGPGLPWHRVVNAQGGLSTETEEPGRQRALLSAEGVKFGPDGRIDLVRHQWRPRVRNRRRGL
jgi:methylated-DNA-protein-cysteine methyltransferase related protein